MLTSKPDHEIKKQNKTNNPIEYDHKSSQQNIKKIKSRNM